MASSKYLLAGFLLILSFLTEIKSEFINGAININYGTFEKVIRNFKAVLVRFDDAYPYGDKHDEFKRLAVAAMTQPDLLIADYGINDDSGKDEDEDREPEKPYISDPDHPDYEAARVDPNDPNKSPETIKAEQDHEQEQRDRDRNRWGGNRWGDDDYPPYSGSGSGGYSGSGGFSGSGMDDDYPKDVEGEDGYKDDYKDDYKDEDASVEKEPEPETINVDEPKDEEDDEGKEDEWSGSGSGGSGSGEWTDSEEKDDDEVDAEAESAKSRIQQADDEEAYEDMEQNRVYAETMGIKKDDWPMFVLYINSQKRNLTYVGEVTAEDMKAWIMKETGLWLGLPFCMEKFDEIVEAFLKLETPEEMTDAVQQAEGFASTLDDYNEQESAKMYITYMNKVIEKGKDFIGTEMERVNKLRGGQVSDNKKEQLRNRYYMLTSFIARMPKKKEEL